MTEPVIQVRDLHHIYLQGTPLAHQALRGVDLTVYRGQMVALVGVTGSGKSTLLQHLNGILRPQQGTVQVLGVDLGDPAVDMRQIRRRVGLVFQRPGDQLFEALVGDDIAFAPRQFGLRGAELRERVRWAMEWAGLDWETYRDRPIAALSGGERRRVGLAGVIALRPEILLLDEPTAGLDPLAHAELLDRLRAFRAQGGTLVWATHHMDDVALLADRVCALGAGQVFFSGSPQELFGDLALLKRLGLELPTAARMARALRAEGVPLRTDLLTLDELEAELVALISEARYERV